MNHKLITLWMVVLIVGLPFNSGVLGQGSNDRTSYDTDGDGVCNWREDDSDHADDIRLAKENNVCRVTPYGDLCPGTIGRANHYGREDSGCSNEQLERIRDYWSVSLDDLNPNILKVNWITDSDKGVLVYQPLKLVKNIRAGDEDIEIRSVGVSCNSGNGIIGRGSNVRVVPGNYVSSRVVPVEDSSSEERAIEFKVLPRGEEGDSGVREKSVLDELEGGMDTGIDAIDVDCIVRTYSCKREGTTCRALSPPELDEVKVSIPIDTTALQPPEFVLDKGIELSQDIIDLTEKLIPKVEWVYKFTLKWCGLSLAAVFASRFLSFLGDGFSTIADTIWYGPEELRNGYPGFTVKSKSKTNAQNSFIISGRSMCAAALCPESWCKALDWVKSKGKEGEPAGLTKTKATPNRPARQRTIQDSLVMSIGCGCVSGILGKLYYLKALAESWNICLNDARAGNTFKGNCDKVLSNGVCTFILDELGAISGVNLMSIAYNRVFKGAVTEATEAVAIRNRVDLAANRVKDFATGEVAELGQAAGTGVLGFQDFQVARTMCSLAIYQRFPDIDIYERFDLDKPQIKTSTSINWDYNVAYMGPNNEAVYEYSVDWMIVAGRDNLRYEVFLQSPQGAKTRIDRKRGHLTELGDHESDYIQFLDGVEYTEACIDVPDEFVSPQCFSVGEGGSGGILGDFFGFEDPVSDDTDRDGLPDEWERLYNGPTTKLDPNLQDSDNNGIWDGQEDWDGDGFSNYQEYKEGTHPREVNDETVDSDCEAVFTSELNLNAAYNLGETIKIEDLRMNVKDPINRDGVFVKVEITGVDRDYRENKYFDVNEIIGKDSFDLWEIPTLGYVPSTGNYNVKATLRKRTSSLSGEPCTDANKRVSSSVVETNIVIYNRDLVSCYDSDGGDDRHEQGVCIDASGNKVDTCSTIRQVEEYTCEATGQCESTVDSCEGNEVCDEGRCVLESYATLLDSPGICFDKGSKVPRYDSCDGDKRITYDLDDDGKCILQPPQDCVFPDKVCRSKSFTIDKTNFPGQVQALNDRDLSGNVNIGVCVDKPFDAKEQVIVIDPGHGTPAIPGDSSAGATAKDGTLEYNLNWELSEVLKTALKQKGYTRVVRTKRSAERNIKIESRVKVANDANAAVLISLHVDDFLRNEDGKCNDLPNILGMSVIYNDGNNVRNNEKTGEFGRMVSDNLRRANLFISPTGASPITDERLSGHSLGVIRDTTMPALLIETGFICKDTHLTRLKAETYRGKLANALADGIDEFLKSQIPPSV